MLTSFFSNSKPFHFLLVSLLLFTGYSVYMTQEINTGFSFTFLVKTLLQFGLYILLFLIYNFIIKKNKLTQINSYALFLFCCFILMVPILFKQTNITYSLLFLLLAFRRILSLNSKKNIQKKILDASIWISIAALFYFWSVLFVIVLYVAIIQLATKNYKLFFIPIVGILSIFVLTTVYYFYTDNNLWWFMDYNNLISFDFSIYYTLQILISFSFILLIGLLSVIFKIINFSNTPLKEKSKYWILIFSFLTGLVLIVFSASKNGSEIIYMFIPISILFTSLIESIQKKWISETLLWLVLIIPFIIYLV